MLLAGVSEVLVFCHFDSLIGSMREAVLAVNLVDASGAHFRKGCTSMPYRIVFLGWVSGTDCAGSQSGSRFKGAFNRRIGYTMLPW